MKIMATVVVSCKKTGRRCKRQYVIFECGGGGGGISANEMDQALYLGVAVALITYIHDSF